MSKAEYVYLLASRPYGTLYVGVTSTLVQRVWQHKEGLVEGFTRKYNIKQLVWFEQCDEIAGAIQREKQIKDWKRQWKIDLIQRSNPQWRDLYHELLT